jgi:beta-N-acetylhexosaminidase
MPKRSLAILFILLLSLPSMSAPRDNPPKEKKKSALVKPGPIELTKDGRKWVDKTLKKMSLEQKIGQLIMVRGFTEFQNDESLAYLNLRDEIRKFHIGSVIVTVRVDGGFLYRNQPYEAAMATNRMQEAAEFPLLIAADFERGLSMRLFASPAFPPAMAFGAAGKPEYAETFGQVVARESRAIGVHWNFFPVADVNSNPLNPIINIRSFGEDPRAVSAMLAGYIRGSRANGLLTTAKHFPGHGDTDTDSHLELARVSGSLERLQSVELPPFEEAIKAGVDSIMIAHVTVPALEPDPNRVATTSHKVVTDLLIDKMGFKGLIVTDALEMKGLTRIYNGDQNAAMASGRAAVDAFKAGNDMMLLPENTEGAFNGLLRAVRSGEITQPEVDMRVRKILTAKASLGLHKSKFVDLDAIADQVGKPADFQTAQQIADAAVTLVKDDSPALKLIAAERRRGPGTSAPQPAYEKVGGNETGVVAVVLSDSVRSEAGRVFERELKARVPDAKVIFVDPSLAAPLTESVSTAVLRARSVIVAAYISPIAAKAVMVNGVMKNTVSFTDEAATLLRMVLKVGANKTAVIAMGSPYVAAEYPEVQTYICTFSNTPTSETSAVKALFGEIGFHGRLPVTLPNMAQRGSGIDRNAVTARRGIGKTEQTRNRLTLR